MLPTPTRTTLHCLTTHVHERRTGFRLCSSVVHSRTALTRNCTSSGVRELHGQIVRACAFDGVPFLIVCATSAMRVLPNVRSHPSSLCSLAKAFDPLPLAYAHGSACISLPCCVFFCVAFSFHSLAVTHHPLPGNSDGAEVGSFRMAGVA